MYELSDLHWNVPTRAELAIFNLLVLWNFSWERLEGATKANNFVRGITGIWFHPTEEFLLVHL